MWQTKFNEAFRSLILEKFRQYKSSTQTENNRTKEVRTIQGIVCLAYSSRAIMVEYSSHSDWRPFEIPEGTFSAPRGREQRPTLYPEFPRSTESSCHFAMVSRSLHVRQIFDTLSCRSSFLYPISFGINPSLFSLISSSNRAGSARAPTVDTDWRHNRSLQRFRSGSLSSIHPMSSRGSTAWTVSSSSAGHRPQFQAAVASSLGRFFFSTHTDTVITFSNVSQRKDRSMLHKLPCPITARLWKQPSQDSRRRFSAHR